MPRPSGPDPSELGAILAVKLADASVGPLPSLTPRRVAGQVQFSGKVTAVIGMRRAGKTSFLHQLRDERVRGGVPLGHLPYVN